jgi:hypothetical protein
VAQGVVEPCVSDEDPARDLPAEAAAGVSHDDEHAECGGSTEQHQGRSIPRDHEALPDGRAKKWSPLWSSSRASSAIGSFPAGVRRSREWPVGTPAASLICRPVRRSVSNE